MRGFSSRNIWNVVIFALIWANFMGKVFDFWWKFPKNPSGSKTPRNSKIAYCFSAKWKSIQFGVLSIRGFGSGKSETLAIFALIWGNFKGKFFDIW